MWNSSRSTQAVRLHKLFFLWSVPRGFTSLLREEMENSLLDDSVALWSKWKLLIIVGALITHSMFPPQGYPSSALWLLPSKHTGSGVGSCASHGQSDRGILSSPGLETPSTRPCWVLHAWFKEIGGGLFSHVEGLKKKWIQTFSFVFIFPIGVPFSHSLHKFERISRLFSTLLFFLPPLQTWVNIQAPLQLMGYHNPVFVQPQFQRRSCKRTKPPWNISIRNADTKSSLFPYVPGLFLFTAFRSSPLWIREPWKCLNVRPQPKIVGFCFVLFCFFLLP